MTKNNIDEEIIFLIELDNIFHNFLTNSSRYNDKSNNNDYYSNSNKFKRSIRRPPFKFVLCLI